MTSTLEPDSRDSTIKTMYQYKAQFGVWNNYSANTYSIYNDSTFEIAFATKFPDPNISWGPPFLPVIPNFYYVNYRLFESDDYNFFVEFFLKSKSGQQKTDVSKVHFYELKDGKEIGIDTIKFIPEKHWFLLESEIERTLHVGLVLPTNRIIKDSIITTDSVNFVRYNLKVNSYKIDEGLIIRFDKGFIVNDPKVLPEIRLFRKNKYHLAPFIFGS
ncbi:MAG: hypothetical protein JST20_12110 [Bacteroidetes bacterium]|nr:hypothetical protein [Bacteroidota bacterium]